MVSAGFYEIAHANDSFDTDEAVERTARAVAETLGESLSRGEAVDLAENLPAELSDPLLEASEESEQPESPPLDAFYDRVAERAGLKGDEATVKSQAIGVALSETADEEVEDALAQLPPEYEELFHPKREVYRERFARTVQQRLDLDSEPVARDASRAVLGALGERLPKGEAEDLAVYLPADAEDWLVVDDPAEATDWTPAEFLTAVEDRAPDVDASPRDLAEGVLGTVGEVATDEEVDRALAQLPAEFESFFHP